MLEERLIDLKRELTTYADFVEQMIRRCIRGLLDGNREILKDIIEKDEPKANQWEIGVDTLCTNLIAQFQPRARDLRTILMALGMNKDLERMADHAVNIAEDALYLIERPQVKPLIDIPRMAEEVTGMVRDSLLSFVKGDAQLARAVCERDSIVDALQDQVVRELITYMSSDPSTIERSVHLLNITKNLERIADLSTNVGEDVIFTVEGRVIKHHKEEDAPAGG
ncbi:MAG: phosphate signaling complex protein PhoU [Syntrophorhabdales bacterium]|jgi:phosphate transport system protein